MEHNKNCLDYKIQRSKRKTIAIKVEPNGSISVKAPYHLSDDAIHGFIDLKRQWIDSKLKAFKSRQIKCQSFDNGAEVFLAGQRYVLEHKEDMKSSVEIIGDKVHIKHNVSDAQTLVEICIKNYAKQFLSERLQLLSMKAGLMPNKVSIKTQRKRWGSCTSNKHILLNWRLIFAPLDVIDYVIYHELCHLQQMDHSKAFWDLVSKAEPEYKSKREWLKKNGQIIEWPNNCVNKTL